MSTKANRIVSFKKRRKAEYKFKANISIHIVRNDEEYILDWSSPDEKISEEQIYKIQRKILSKLIAEVDLVEYSKEETYDKDITLLYFEKNNKKFTYICLPRNIKKEKLAEYLLVSTNIYELKKAGAL